ncbi:MAG: [FeFe] hydrogenase, group A [Lachnospiraceae bacterium]|nr:[FeFe] hydrogenase, group A [Lachnospiraceae bacterium]
MEKNKNCINVSDSNPAIVKENALCTDCGHCRAVCMEEINVAGHTIPGRENEKFCIHCGQCAAACPEQAIQVKKELGGVKAAIRDPKKIVVFSTSPSVRVGIGDEFLEKSGVYSEGKMVAALRKLGGDYVLDVTFSADLTIMEEGSELLERIVKQDKALPQFTSCCPAWVKYVETYHPDLIPNLSTAKSPIGMQGAVIKTYFATKHHLNPEDIVSVAVTPCTAKKFEIRRPELEDAGKLLGISGMRDNDFVITTKELVQWMKEEGIDFNALEEESFDCILGKGSGAGVIFGNTGGVMEAALRMAYECLTGESPKEALLHFEPVRGMQGIKEASVQIGDVTVNTAVVYGTANAEKLLNGDLSKYHFIEVMTCPGGCIAGAGQPQRNEIPPSKQTRLNRISSMYQEDARMELRNSIDNPEIGTIYHEFLKEPLSEMSEQLLHTSYYKR